MTIEQKITVQGNVIDEKNFERDQKYKKQTFRFRTGIIGSPPGAEYILDIDVQFDPTVYGAHVLFDNPISKLPQSTLIQYPDHKPIMRIRLDDHREAEVAWTHKPDENEQQETRKHLREGNNSKQ